MLIYFIQNVMLLIQVVWLPYHHDPIVTIPISLFCGIIHYRTITEAYMPERCLRQFGYVQTIPAAPQVPTKVYLGLNPKLYVVEHDPNRRNWDMWQAHCISPERFGSFRCINSSDTMPGYMRWFRARSHPRVVRPDSSNVVDEGPPSPSRLPLAAVSIKIFKIFMAYLLFIVTNICFDYSCLILYCSECNI